MRRLSTVLAAVIIAVGFTAQVHASLTVLGTDSLGYQLIYDSGLNVTWYDYTNGSGNWQNQNDWATNLTVLFQGQTITGWRLPQTTPVNGSAYDYNWSNNGSTDQGWNISAPGSAYPGSRASEMAYLFYYELGNSGEHALDGSTSSNYGLSKKGVFEELINSGSNSYWSGYDGTAGQVFQFSTGSGYQATAAPTWGLFAIAVHPGNVSSVPVPSAILLFGGGFAGLGVYRRRLAKKG